MFSYVNGQNTKFTRQMEKPYEYWDAPPGISYTQLIHVSGFPENRPLVSKRQMAGLLL